MAVQQLMEYKQPIWPSGQGHGKLAMYMVNGKSVIDKPWPIFESKVMSLKNGILQIQVPGFPTYSMTPNIQ